MKVRILIVVLLLILTTLSVQAQDQPDDDTVRFVTTAWALGNANSLLAQEEGFFAAQGITLEVVENVANTTYAPEPLVLLADGAIDVFLAPLTPGLFNTILRGGELTAVAIGSYNPVDAAFCPYTTFYTNAGMTERFQSADGWRGARLATGSGITSYLVDLWVAQFGLTIDDLVVENMTNAVRGEALANNAVDVISLIPPATTFNEDAYGFEPLFEARDVAPNAYVSMLVFGPRMFESDLGVRYLTAFLQGSRQANEGATARNVDLFAAATETDPELIASTCWPHFSEDGLADMAFLTGYTDWMLARGEIDGAVDLETFYNPALVMEAYARLEAMAPEATEAPSG